MHRTLLSGTLGLSMQYILKIMQRNVSKRPENSFSLYSGIWSKILKVILGGICNSNGAPLIEFGCSILIKWCTLFPKRNERKLFSTLVTKQPLKNVFIPNNFGSDSETQKHQKKWQTYVAFLLGKSVHTRNGTILIPESELESKWTPFQA